MKRAIVVLVLFLMLLEIVAVPVQAVTTTIITSTTSNAILSSMNSRLYHANSYWLLFFGDGTNQVYSSCLDTNNCGGDNAKWSVKATVVSAIANTQLFGTFYDYTNNKFYYARSLAAVSTVNYRRYSFSGGVLIADYAEQTFATSQFTGAAGITMTTDGALGNIFIAVDTCTTSGCAGGQTSHVEVWKATDGASPTTTSINDISTALANTRLSGIIMRLAGGRLGMVYGSNAVTGLQSYISCPAVCSTSNDWTPPQTMIGSYIQQLMHCSFVTNTVYCVARQGGTATKLEYMTIPDGGSWTELLLDTAPANINGEYISTISTANSVLAILYCTATSCFHQLSTDSGSTWTKTTDFVNETAVSSSGAILQGVDVAQSDGKVGAIYLQGSGSPFNIKFYDLVLPAVVITNSGRLSLTYTASKATGLSTNAGTVAVDYGTVVNVAGIYSCAYTIQNSSFIYQFSPSGLQILTASPTSGILDNIAGVNHIPSATFTETGHVILCIPSASALTIQNIYVNGAVSSFSKSADSAYTFFSGSGSNEVDFVPAVGNSGGGTTSTTTTSTTSQPTSSLLSFNVVAPLFIIGSGVMVILVLATRRKMNS